MADSGKTQKRVTNKKSNGKFDPDYYVLGNLLYMSIIAFGIWLMLLSTISPTKIPAILGPLKLLGEYLGVNHPYVCILICIGCFSCHFYESLIARSKCKALNLSRTATVKWTVSTFMFGFPFLLRLDEYAQFLKET